MTAWDSVVHSRSFLLSVGPHLETPLARNKLPQADERTPTLIPTQRSGAVVELMNSHLLPLPVGLLLLSELPFNLFVNCQLFTRAGAVLIGAETSPNTGSITSTPNLPPVNLIHAFPSPPSPSLPLGLERREERNSSCLLHTLFAIVLRLHTSS